MPEKTGWTNFGGQSSKWHYIAAEERSLCRKWAIWKTHELQQGNDDSPDNCAACKKRLTALRQKKEAP